MIRSHFPWLRITVADYIPLLYCNAHQIASQSLFYVPEAQEQYLGSGTFFEKV